VEQDDHLLTLCRYVERNPVAAGLVGRAEEWRWSSLWVRLRGDAQQKSILSEWPVERPRDWTRWVNQSLHENEREAIKTSLGRGRPLGSEAWTQTIAARLGLGYTLRGEGRPKKVAEGEN